MGSEAKIFENHLAFHYNLKPLRPPLVNLIRKNIKCNMKMTGAKSEFGLLSLSLGPRENIPTEVQELQHDAKKIPCLSGS